MPLKVRLKLLLIILLVALGLWLSSLLSLGLTLGLLVLTLLYIEMIYPKWNFFGRAILNVRDKGSKAIAITFDDGPSEWTLRILDALKAEQVKATFFLLGKNIERYPEIARKIQEDGHLIGMHGYSHTKLHFKSAKFIQSDLDQCENVFRAVGLKIPKYFRFPHGFKNFFGVSEVRKRNLILCGWGRGVWDSKRPGVDWIVARSLELRPGEILLLHDGDGVKEKSDRSQTVQALPQIIQGLKAKGYEFVTF